MKLEKSAISGFLLLFILLILLAFSLKISLKELFDFEFSLSTAISDLFISFFRVSFFAVISWISGIFGGYLIYHNSILNSLFLPTINFMRNISPFAWLPFAIAWFGLGEAPVAFIMFITLFFPTLIAASDSFSNISQDYIDEAKVSGASQSQLFLKIELPLTFLNLINLFRIIWGLGWATIIAAEMLGVKSGLGFRLLDFRYLLQYSKMLYYLIIMGITGVFIDFLLRKLADFIKIKMFGI